MIIDAYAGEISIAILGKQVCNQSPLVHMIHHAPNEIEVSNLMRGDCQEDFADGL